MRSLGITPAELTDRIVPTLGFDAQGEQVLDYGPRQFTVRLYPERMHFFSRVERHLPWHVILAVDQSASMLDSVIHSAVLAGILAGLPALRMSLIVFDTSVVDLSGCVDDPTELLLSVQLDGGTDIGGALAYCETLVETPQRTIVIVVTDFYEGGRSEQLIARMKQLREAGVVLLGLVGLGAQQWRTRSGYAGLSLFFWDSSAGRWATWSESRPAFYENVRFDPAQRYRQQGPWSESPALTHLCLGTRHQQRWMHFLMR